MSDGVSSSPPIPDPEPNRPPSHTPATSHQPYDPQPTPIVFQSMASASAHPANEFLMRRLQRSASSPIVTPGGQMATPPAAQGLSTPSTPLTSRLLTNAGVQESEIARGPSTTPRTRSASDAFGHDFDVEDGIRPTPRTPPNPAKYLRLASTIPGLTPEQISEAASMAEMTPRSARVVHLGHVMSVKNVTTKLQAHVLAAQKHWDIPPKLKKRIAIHSSIAIMTPLPKSYKQDCVPVIYQLLKDSNNLPTDIDKHEKWEQDVNSEIGTALSNARFDVKAKILASLAPPDEDTPADLFSLTKAIVDELSIKKYFHITHAVLQGVAYLRGNIEEQRLQDPDSVGRHMWDLLDIRVRITRDGVPDGQPRDQHMEEWLVSDVSIHGPFPADAKVKGTPTTLQRTIFEAMQSDTQESDV